MRAKVVGYPVRLPHLICLGLTEAGAFLTVFAISATGPDQLMRRRQQAASNSAGVTYEKGRLERGWRMPGTTSHWQGPEVARSWWPKGLTGIAAASALPGKMAPCQCDGVIIAPWP